MVSERHAAFFGLPDSFWCKNTLKYGNFQSHIFDSNATVTDPDHLAGLDKATLGIMICV